MSPVIPLRAFENALRQASRMQAPPDRTTCIRRVLSEIHAGRDGNAVAGELQRTRLQQSTTPGGAA